MPRVAPITCATKVQEEGYVLSAIDGTGRVCLVTMDFGDCEGMLRAVPVNRSFVGMFTSPGRSQYVASTFATTPKITQKQRFFKGVFSDSVNSLGAFHHYMFVNVNLDLGELPYKKDGGARRFPRS